MARIGIILSTDYELFGNGTGSVTNCLMEPMREMATVAGEFRAPITVFFDVCEYWAFKEAFDSGQLQVNEASQIKNQLIELSLLGNDVQLHMHPQWLRYKYHASSWELDHNLWRISSLNFVDQTDPDLGLKRLFERGKETLESMLKPVLPNYVCNAFRAGAWSMQPEQAVLRAMIETGFQFDSTTVPGLVRNDGYSLFDFRGLPPKSDWIINDSFAVESEDGIRELPIFSTEVPLHKRLEFLLKRYRRKLKFKPLDCEGYAESAKNKFKLEALLDLLRNSLSMFTFSDAACSEEMIYFAEQAIKRYSRDERERVPVVAISHPKSFANSLEFREFLLWATKKKEIEFITFQNLLNE